MRACSFQCARLCKRRRDIPNRAIQDEGIILRREESAAAPETRGLLVDSVDHQGAPADQLGRRDAALERMLDKPGANAFAGPIEIRRKLPQQQTRHGVGRLSCSNRSGKCAGGYRGRRQTIIADDATFIVNHHNRGKSLLLIR